MEICANYPKDCLYEHVGSLPRSGLPPRPDRIFRAHQFSFSVLFLIFLFVIPCGRLGRPSVSFPAHAKYIFCIVLDVEERR